MCGPCIRMHIHKIRACRFDNRWARTSFSFSLYVRVPVFRLPDVLHNLGKKVARQIDGCSSSRWNPPMLGPLPTDFLRLTTTGNFTSQVNVYISSPPALVPDRISRPHSSGPFRILSSGEERICVSIPTSTQISKRTHNIISDCFKEFFNCKTCIDMG